MESVAKIGVLIVSALALVFATAWTTHYYFVSSYICVKNNKGVPMKDGSMEYLDRFHDSAKKVTAIRGIGAEKCYILFDDLAPQEEGRKLRIIAEPIAAETMLTIAGEKISEFCGDLTAYPVQLLNRERYDILRRKRQTSPFPNQEKNECQDQVIVDCGAGNGGVYECITGPATVYRATTKCESATKFTFTLEKRCDEFPKTKGIRFLKCILAFIRGTHVDS